MRSPNPQPHLGKKIKIIKQNKEEGKKNRDNKKIKVNYLIEELNIFTFNVINNRKELTNSILLIVLWLFCSSLVPSSSLPSELIIFSTILL